MECKCEARFHAKFTETTGKFCAKFSEVADKFCAYFGEVVEIIPDPYAGPYEVIPKWHEQELATASKNMAYDVTVHKIPLFKTLNPAGGDTVIIGG